MKHEEFIDYMAHTVDGWKDSAELDSSKIQYAGFLRTVEQFRDSAKFHDNAKVAMHELLVEFSKSSLRSLLLVNTGGIFVLMTIISSMLSKESNFQKMIPAVASKSVYFIAGVSLSVATVLLAYLAQWLYNNTANIKYGLSTNVLAIVVGLGSFVFFIVGSVELMNLMSSQTMASILEQMHNATK